MQKIFDGQAADGSSTARNWHGGYGTVVVAGTFGGGTVTLNASPDGGTTWVQVGYDARFTADGMANFQLPGGMQLRLTLSGATNPDLDAWIG
jgi:hypothetical protein